MTDIDKLKEEATFKSSTLKTIKEITRYQFEGDDTPADDHDVGILDGINVAVRYLASQGRILQEGFVAVPVEPTREMLNAGMFAPTARRSPSDTAEIIYKAMIAAQEGKE